MDSREWAYLYFWPSFICLGMIVENAIFENRKFALETDNQAPMTVGNFFVVVNINQWLEDE